MMKPVRKGWLGLLLAASVAVAVASLLVGTESISLTEAWSAWRRGVPAYESPSLGILLHQRLPRTLAALLAGGGLALVGTTFQALLRNPLATPYTLGMASAGALGAWIATILFPAAWVVYGFSPVQALAFVFAALDMAILYVMALRRRRLSPAILLLAGVTLGMIANAGILFMRYLARPDQLIMMDRWLMGAVDVLGFEPVIVLAVGVLPFAALLLAQGSKFDQLGFDPEMASARGVDVGRLQFLTFAVGSLMTAIIVSKVGPIGFVGLIVPHAVRSLTGSRHRLLMAASFIAGGGFLCLSDIAARKLVAQELPIGVVTALVGGPFFLSLLLRRRLTDWEW
jgi:iron complex transport system permease protein